MLLGVMVVDAWRDLWCGRMTAVAIASPIVMYIAAAVYITGGEFTYAVDDAYIHLELAKHIFHGHYGINEGEFTAPSSSVVWPFFLVPFAFWLPLFELAPLVIGAVTAWLTGLIIFRLFRHLGLIPALVITLVMTYTLNINGLVLYGMEHGVQILLVAIVTAGLMRPARLQESRAHRIAFYAALTLLPLVRYDSMALVLPVLAYQFLRGDYRNAVLSGLISGGGLALFSGFLLLNDIGWMPLSVSTKSRVFDLPSALRNIDSHLLTYQTVVLMVGLLCIGKLRTNALMACVIALVTALFFVFQTPYPLGRYEPFFLLFIALLCLDHLVTIARPLWLAVLLSPIVFASTTYFATFAAVGSGNMHSQQRQMGGIAQQLNAPVAINDLGLVSYRSDHYILDLLGLASKEAAELRAPYWRLQWTTGVAQETTWDVDFMARHNVHYAMVYERVNSPQGWIRVATLDLHQRRVTPAYSQVLLMADSPKHAQIFRDVIADYSREHPSENFSFTLTDDIK